MTTFSDAAFDFSHWFTDVAQRWNRALPARAAAITQGQATSVPLSRGETHASMGLQGQRIECVSGCIWLTHDGDCRDVVLKAGQAHVLDRSSRLLIHALGSSAIRLLHFS
jgi:hypothetical protein